ncbi:hypothetical protein FB45DRAFT_861053 [Roridomyces roridus]|uniref:Uncharacterized protein n=1 Tax=Roridomyces roridus TaxID=1738132 RepID=A0AAD7CH33_9AGAR|nr:hypothetical protein FB45DRAFT_861053 [Roridomyces roridus]
MSSLESVKLAFRQQAQLFPSSFCSQETQKQLLSRARRSPGKRSIEHSGKRDHQLVFTRPNHALLVDLRLLSPRVSPVLISIRPLQSTGPEKMGSAEVGVDSTASLRWLKSRILPLATVATLRLRTSTFTLIGCEYSLRTRSAGHRLDDAANVVLARQHDDLCAVHLSPPTLPLPAKLGSPNTPLLFRVLDCWAPSRPAEGLRRPRVDNSSMGVTGTRQSPLDDGVNIRFVASTTDTLREALSLLNFLKGCPEHPLKAKEPEHVETAASEGAARVRFLASHSLTGADLFSVVQTPDSGSLVQYTPHGARVLLFTHYVQFLETNSHSSQESGLDSPDLMGKQVQEMRTKSLSGLYRVIVAALVHLDSQVVSRCN